MSCVHANLHKRPPGYRCDDCGMIVVVGEPKVQRVIEAARAWWRFYGDNEEYTPQVRRDLAAAVRALDAPVERWSVKGAALYDNGNMIVSYEDRLMEQIAAALNAAEREKVPHGRH